MTKVQGVICIYTYVYIHVHTCMIGFWLPSLVGARYIFIKKHPIFHQKSPTLHQRTVRYHKIRTFRTPSLRVIPGVYIYTCIYIRVYMYTYVVACCGAVVHVVAGCSDHAPKLCGISHKQKNLHMFTKVRMHH